MRVDLWLFHARLFKSRTQATTACKEGRILRSDRKLDAADFVKENDLIELRDRGLYRSYRILEMPGKNVSKDVAKTTYREETAQEIVQRYIEMKETKRTFSEHKSKPTKRERREIDKFKGRR